MNTTKSHFNTLKITGEFSKSDIHTWIANCLPDFPHNLESEEGEVTTVICEIMFLTTLLIIGKYDI